MAVYTFHLPQDAIPGDEKALERAVLVRDGFSWGALIFQLLWSLWNRLWLVSLGLILVSVALSLGLEWMGLPEIIVGIAGMVFAIWFAYEANNLRRLTLERHGLAMRGVIVARNEQEAECRAFSIWLERAKSNESREEHVPISEVATSEVTPPHHPSNPHARDTGVIGLFPQAEEPR